MEPVSDEGPVPADEADGSTPRHAGRTRRRRPSLLREVTIIFVSALVLSWLVKTFLVQPFYIPSISMEDTLLVGDRVLVSKLTPGPFELHRGDVVVFKDPGGWLEEPPEPEGVQRFLNPALRFLGLLPEDSGEHLIKRVIGLPGDRVACCTDAGELTVNGVAIDETVYIKPGSLPSQVEFDQVVPEGSLWVMGDNRQHSHDSRFTGGLPGGGFVPVDNVVGVSFLKVWPLDRFSTMRNPGEVFAEVPEP